MQNLFKLLLAIWPLLKQHKKKSLAAAGVGVTSAAMLYSGVTQPPPLITAGNTTNEPGSNGQVLESNGNGTYTFGTDDGGVGGGATELAGLDDVADTLDGASGDFLGWSGTEWDDLTISFSTLTDGAITAAATGEVLRYNGTNWVDAVLDFDDLANTTVTSWATGEVPRWNGSALVDAALSIDDLSEVTIVSPQDNHFLRYDGSGWVNEAVTPGGLDTPDGATGVTLADKYSVKAYGASGSDRDFFCTTSTSGTTTVTTKDNAGSAATHNFIVGQGVVLLDAGAVCSTTAPELTVGGQASSYITQGGSAGSTTYEYVAVAFDGKGGRSAVSAEITTATGAATLNDTDFNILRIHVPAGAHSIGIYGRGTSGRQLLTILESDPIRCNAVEGASVYGVSFTAIADAGGGVALVTLTTGHGILANDIIELNATSSGDDGYDGQYVVASVTATTLTLGAGTWNAGLGTATGTVEAAFVEWRDKGESTGLHPSKWLPANENPDLDYRAGIAQTRGNLVIDSVGSRLFRVHGVTGDGRTSAEPTWPSTANGTVQDGDVVFKRECAFVPVDEPASAGRQALFTTVASTPTASTFTTTDAAGADISSNALACLHNDALAIRACRTAIATAGTGGTMYFPAGVYQMILPDWSDSTYWTNLQNAAAPNYCAIPLYMADSKRLDAGISIELDPAATVRAKLMSNGGRMALNGTGVSQPILGLVGFGSNKTTVRGGSWEYDTFCAGLSEHDGSTSYEGGIDWGIDASFISTVGGIEPQDTLIENVRISFPSIWAGDGKLGADGISYRRLTCRNCEWRYGGGDGNQTLLNHGEFVFDGGLVVNERLFGSHGFYLNTGRDKVRLTNLRMRGVNTAGKLTVQIRGTGGDFPAENVIISNVIFETPSGNMLIGDTSTSNRVHKVAISNCQGAGIAIAEGRDISITGGTYRVITANEDVSGLRISNLSAESIELEASAAADGIFETEISNVNIKTRLRLGHAYGVTANQIHILNPHKLGTVLNSATYEWIATGSNNEYYCRLRSTAGDPGISSPEAVSIRGRNVTNTAGSLGSLASDTWYYGDPDGGGAIAYNTVVVKLGDSTAYDPDAQPYGSVQLATIAATEVGVYIDNVVERIKLTNSDIRSTWTDVDALVAGLGNVTSMKDVLFENVHTEMSGLTGTTTCIMWDFSSSNLVKAEDVVFRGCTWKHANLASAATRAPMRLLLGRGGNIWFDHCKFPSFGSAAQFSSFGCFKLTNCEIQSNEQVMTVDGSGNTLTFATGQVDLVPADGYPVMIFPGETTSSNPTGLTLGTVYYLENETASEVFATQSDATSDINPIDIGTGGPVIVRFLDAANEAVGTDWPYTGSNANPDWWADTTGTIIRGSNTQTKAQITGNQDNYALTAQEVHRISSDAARDITGINGGSPGKRKTLVNFGAQTVTLKNGSTASADDAEFLFSTGADIALAANESIELIYDGVSLKWRDMPN